MSKFYFDNDLKAPVWYYTTFTKSGAYALAKTMIKKYNVVVIEPPRYDKNKDLWYFAFTNPFSVSS